jgi:phosphopantetheinyl transferase
MKKLIMVLALSFALMPSVEAYDAQEQRRKFEYEYDKMKWEKKQEQREFHEKFDRDQKRWLLRERHNEVIKELRKTNNRDGIKTY